MNRSSPLVYLLSLISSGVGFSPSKPHNKKIPKTNMKCL